MPIGDQCWIARNLDVGPAVAGRAPRDAAAVEKTCYGNDPESCRVYGGLYTWDEARGRGDGGGLPGRLALPSRGEWETLAAHLGTATAGETLKAREDHVPPFDGTDAVGFTALPGGSGFRGSFGRQGHWAVFWTVDRERRRAGGLGPARPVLEPGPRATATSSSTALPQGERVLGALREGRRVRRAGPRPRTPRGCCSTSRPTAPAPPAAARPRPAAPTSCASSARTSRRGSAATATPWP